MLYTWQYDELQLILQICSCAVGFLVHGFLLCGTWVCLSHPQATPIGKSQYTGPVLHLPHAKEESQQTHIWQIIKTKYETAPH